MEIRRCQVKNLKEKVKLFIKKVHLLKDVYGSMIDIELKMRWFNDFVQSSGRAQAIANGLRIYAFLSLWSKRCTTCEIWRPKVGMYPVNNVVGMRD